MEAWRRQSVQLTAPTNQQCMGGGFCIIIMEERGNRSTVDMIFCLRQIKEKCIEHDRPLYMVCVDFSKALEAVGRTGLWQLLRNYGCPEKFITMIEALYIPE